ncbi:hypothetical protein [Alicyclobacillus ferrooxydans]|uniref:hypothetical protein n=1 Tax=Alicyclobacillus ferrooxydans TaxID=471514 RepID=UPI0006D53180|nr:hypothetical protein [Alicyclobacillus ferrooxydans]
MPAKITKTNADYPQTPYDLIREMFIALGVIGVLVLLCAAIFSTPDVPALTAKQVATQAPQLFIQTALDDLSGQDAISTYGPPYNTNGQAQTLGPISPEAWAGVQIPIMSDEVEVLAPLRRYAVVNPSITPTLNAWSSASSKQQTAWVNNVEKYLDKAKLVNGSLVLPQTKLDYGPVPQILNAYLRLARSGILEDTIDGSHSPMPAVNRTKSLLLLQDQPAGQYAQQLNMSGGQWGIIKETGNYPGAVWLWFYTMLYQIPPYSNSSSADLLVVSTILVVTLILVFLPFIPGLRAIPHALKVYRLIWRNYYQYERLHRRNNT